MDEERNSIIQTQTIVTLNITPKALQQCLMFIYTGTIDKEYMELQVSDFDFPWNKFVIEKLS
jgi:Rho-related BTB domain-containing protein 1/2